MGLGITLKMTAVLKMRSCRCTNRVSQWHRAALTHGSAAPATAEDLYRQALDWARRQGALSLELRAATSLARLLRGQGRSADVT